MSWNYKKYGSAEDPVHKSHLSDIVGDYGCPQQFRYKMDERSGLSIVERDEIARVSGKAACGTAVHETLARALSSADVVKKILAGQGVFEPSGVMNVFKSEFEREVGGREVWWADKDDEDKLMNERVEMVCGLLQNLHHHVSEILLVEAGFVAKLGPYWFCGHTDLVYRPKSRPDQIALADWKTGAQKPATVELDHSWESGVYSHAVHSGYFIHRAESEASFDTDTQQWHAECRGHHASHGSRYIAEREATEAALIEIAKNVDANPPEDHVRRAHELGLVAFDQFPSEIYHVHLQDYVRYQKSGAKLAKRPEDLRFYGLRMPEQVKYIKGDMRGPSWLPCKRTEYDVPRLEARLKKVITMLRMGIFIDNIGEKCERCPYAQDCLNTGYAPVGDERSKLEHALLRIPHVSDGLDDGPSVPKRTQTS
jgi:hypothetical protein